MPCATILYHPDLRRVGQRAVLDPLMRGQAVRISRLEPVFAHPGEERGAALDDPYVSASRPVRLAVRWPHGLEIAPAEGARVLVDGAPLDRPRTAALLALRRGLMLVLAKRVVLLIHDVDISRPPGDPLGLVGHSDAIEEVRRAVTQVADLDIPVLIRGESGAGKEHVARAIHQRSARAGGPYIVVNMAAIHPETAVSELFGHGKGAFTGATWRRTGLFEQADRGTLFLDEIGDTPEVIQSMLLRVLQSGDIQPLGESGRRVDVRVVAATDADLEAARLSGAFRSALLHRLAGYELRVPPLRERRDDIARLVVYILRRELAHTGELHRLAPPGPDERPWFPARLMARLVDYSWRGGNVRELANVVRQLVVSNRGADVLALDRHVDALLVHRDRAGDTGEVDATAGPAPAPAHSRMPRPAPADIGDDELIAALKAHDFGIRPTAAALGLPASTLYGLIEKSPRLRTVKDIPCEELIRCQAEHGNDLDAMARHLMVPRRGLKRRLKELDLL